MPPHPTAFDWSQAQLHHRDCLPHLRQPNALYFITFRLNDSLPQSKLKHLRTTRDAWLAKSPPPHSEEQQAEYKKIWTAPIEILLDAGHGSCLLKHPENRKPLEDTLHHDDKSTYQLGPFIIMPNHVHVLIYPLPNQDLSQILQSWKSISARKINKSLSRRGPLWQPESFDHIVRSEAHWKKHIAYIQKNPTHLRPQTYTLSQGSLSSPE